MITVSLSSKAKKNLDRRISNVKWTLLQQAQFRAMTKATNIVKKSLLTTWQREIYHQNGPMQIHRKAIESNITSRIKRPGGSKVLGFVGIGRKDMATSIVNIIDPGFKARTGAMIPGRNNRAAMFFVAMEQAKLFTQYLGETAKKMLAGK
tara:strand:- start:213 stop:662 length:450 start_codon:yes stop_codon:yes gene_type:complete